MHIRLVARLLLWITILSLATACRGPVLSDGSQVPPASRAAPTVPAASIASPMALRTPPSLPASYQSSYLNPLDTPHTYIGDSCKYLRDKWTPGKAAPGTIVLIVMLHSINQGRAESPDAITDVLFSRMMEDLHQQRFQAITTQQLADFLQTNTNIPSRSVVLMQDGRRYADSFEKHFRHYWIDWGWPVVNAWDDQGSTTEAFWAQQAALEEEGWVDHQVYGPTLRPAGAGISEQELTQRLQSPIPVFQKRFDKVPVGVVWPSGFGARSVQVARQLGYQLGFTLNPRGPVMFNWVPLADEADGSRPSFFPEGTVGDPLMTLPRYWPYDVHRNLDAIRAMGDEAAAYAERNRTTELDYYDIVCAPEYGPLTR